MIEIQVGSGEFFPAVLAGIPIPGKNIVAAEADPALGNPVVGREQNNPGDLDDSIHQPDRLIMAFDAQLVPAFIVEGFILGIDGFGDPRVKQTEGTAHRGNLHGQKGLV